MTHQGDATAAEPAPSTGRGGQLALRAAAAGYAGLLAWQAVALPDHIPGHVGPLGEVTRWDSKASHLLVGLVCGLLLWASF